MHDLFRISGNECTIYIANIRLDTIMIVQRLPFKVRDFMVKNM